MTEKYDVRSIKDRLQSYRERETEIEYQMERLNRYILKMTTVGAQQLGEHIHSGGGNEDRLSQYVARKEELEQRIKTALFIQDREREQLEHLLGAIRSANEKTVIRLRYFDRASWSDVVDILYGQENDLTERRDAYLRRVHKIHGSALQDMAQAMLSEPQPES